MMHPVYQNPKTSGNKEGTDVHAVQNIAVLQCSFLSKYFSQRKDCNNNKTGPLPTCQLRLSVIWGQPTFGTKLFYKIELKCQTLAQKTLL